MPARCPDGLACAFDCSSVAGRYEHLGPLPAQRLGACTPEPLAGSGDKRPTAVEAKIHVHNCEVETTVRVTATAHESGWTCQVSVEQDGRSLSDHVVEVTRSDMERLGLGASVEDLVERSFVFLLDREPPQNILNRFGLTDIERYFPEFARVMNAPTRPR
jgi:hypothetical protein